MPNRYPNIVLIDKLSKLGNFKFELTPGDVVFIGPYLPQSVYDENVKKAKSGLNPYLNIASIRTLFEQRLLNFEVGDAPSYQHPLLNLETQTTNSLVNKGQLHHSPNTALGHAMLDLEEITHIENQFQNFAKSFDDNLKENLNKILEYKDKPEAFPSLYGLLTNSIIRTKVCNLLPARLLQTGLIEDEQQIINKKLLEWVAWVQDNVSDTGKALTSLTEAREKCSNLIQKQTNQLSEQYTKYLENQIGLIMFEKWCEPLNEARQHQPKKHLFNLENLEPDILEDTLNNVKAANLTRGTIVIPSVPNRECLEVLHTFLNDTSHSFIVVTDLLQKPNWVKSDTDIESWFAQLANGPSLLGNQRSHARMATFFPPVFRRTEKYGTQTISPAYVGGALIARTHLTFNPAYRQAPYEIGIIENIDGTEGQMPGGENALSVKLKEQLIAKGINTIGMEYAKQEGKYHFVVEPGRTLNNDPNKQSLLSERVRALLEEVVQDYIRDYIQGAPMTPQQVQQQLDNNVFRVLKQNNIVDNLKVDVIAGNPIKIEVKFDMKDPITAVMVTVEKEAATPLLIL